MVSKRTLRRFWDKVDKRDPDQCWEWTGATRAYRYGCFYFRDKVRAAHRVSFIIHKREIEDGELILHHCDNGLCVNPNHLYAGDQNDNMNDMWERDRHPPTWGEASGQAKLTADQVREIRRRYAAGGVTQKGLASEYGVAKSLVWSIIHRKIWKHIE